MSGDNPLGLHCSWESTLTGIGDPRCPETPTYVDSMGNPWCADHGPSSTELKGKARASIRQSELNRLVKQLHDLREALKPFAFFGSALPPIDPNVERLTDSGVMFNAYVNQVNYNITCADLRRATTLLKQLEAEDYERWVQVAEAKMGPTHQEQLALLQKRVDALRGKDEPELRAELEGKIYDALEAMKGSKA